MGASGVSHLPGREDVRRAVRAIHHVFGGWGYGQLAEVWSDLDGRLTVSLSLKRVVGQILGGGHC